MKTYIVTRHEMLVTTYRVGAEDEADALVGVQCGGGVQLSQSVEQLLDDEEWEAVEEE